MESQFNAQDFLTSQTVEGANETQFSPIPASEYVGIITKLDATRMPKTDGTGEWTILNVTFTVDDARAREATGMDTPTIRDSVFLDIDPATGKIDTGKNKNVQLGRLRDATGTNEGAFNFGMLMGKATKLNVVIEPDKRDSSRLFNRVKAYGKL